MRHLGASLRDQQGDRAHFEDEEGKDSILCLKSSLTYAAKVLSLGLKNVTQDSSLSPSEQTFILANDMLDRITTVELYMGSGHASRIARAAKPWLPDLVLALGSLRALDSTAHRLTSLDTILAGHFPLWLSVLAKTEIPKISKSGSEDDDNVLEECPVSRKIAEMSLALAKRSPVLVDAFREIFLVGSRVGLERREYMVALGLVHFVCTKMFRSGESKWGVAMMAALKDLYPKVVGLVEEEEEEEEDDDEREKL